MQGFPVVSGFRGSLSLKWIRQLVLVIGLVWTGAVFAAPTTIMVMGDSLSAAYGIERESGWVNLLRKRLPEEVDVVNASISGETTSGGAARLPELLGQHNPDIVLLELGGNDGLRGLPPGQMRANLARMIEASRDSGAKVLLLGIEAGIVLGVCCSIVAQLWRGSRPHVAVVGRVPDTHYFRNTKRHLVEIEPHLLALRIDENIFFANTKAVEQAISQALAEYPDTREVLLILSAVNHIDSTGLDMLSELTEGLKERDIGLHLAEVKGPVMDRLQQTAFLKGMTGGVFLSTYDAWRTLQR